MKAYLFLVVFLLASSNPENRWPLFLARGTVSVGGDLVCRYGYINNDGEWIVKPQFSFATGFYNGVAMGNPNAVSNRYLILADGVQVENKHFMRGDHFYDKELKSIVYCNRVSKVRGQLYIDMTPIGPRLKRLLFGKNRKRWLNVLFDAQGGSLQDGFTKSTHTGFIDHTGRVLFSFPLYNGHSYNWGARRPFSDGLAPYTISISKLRDDRTGYIDRNGKLVI